MSSHPATAPSGQSTPDFPADLLNRAGLNRQHVFALDALPPETLATLGDTAPYRQLILLGHGGRLLWERVQAANPTGDHPIDDYTRNVVARWFAEALPGHRHRLLYPDNTPTQRPIGLQALGTLAGWHHPTPFMVGIDDEWGSWFAYRAALLADTDFLPFFQVDRRNPCSSCTAQPCVSACPAAAMANGHFDLKRCLSYRQQPNSRCAATCLARLACPVGGEHRYDADQLRHSYGRSLAMLKAYL